MPRTSASLFICLRCLLLQLVNCLLHIFGALSPDAPAAPAAAGPSLDALCALCLAFLLSCCSCRERYSFYSPSEKQPGRTPHELFCGRRRVCLALCAKIAEHGCCEKQDDAYIFQTGRNALWKIFLWEKAWSHSENRCAILNSERRTSGDTRGAFRVWSSIDQGTEAACLVPEG